MVTGPLANTITLSGQFGYYKIMAINYTLAKKNKQEISW